MTTNGKKTLKILADLEENFPDQDGFTASDVTVNFKGLPNRNSPVMTVSSYLTHLKREGHVSRRASSDKTIAWWSSTAKGRKALNAAQT